MIPALALSTILMLAGLAVVYAVHADRRANVVVAPVATPADGPLISICIPARNEARTISRCVQAALRQTYPRQEIIVIDDASTDSTVDILAELSAGSPELIVRKSAPLPPGWAGKPHALDQAARLAHGTWLCFLDADTTLQPEALISCYLKASETGPDLFTILTRQVAGSFWEKAVMPIVMTALSVGFSPRRVNDPSLPDAVANGQFMLVRRDVYDQLGGHAAINDQIVDDKALAELVKQKGHRLVIADGRAVASTRMYTSLAEMWEGWTKNIYLACGTGPAPCCSGQLGSCFLWQRPSCCRPGCCLGCTGLCTAAAGQPASS